MFKLSVEYYNGEVDQFFSNSKDTIETVGSQLYNEEADLWVSYGDGPAVEFCERFRFGW